MKHSIPRIAAKGRKPQKPQCHRDPTAATVGPLARRTLAALLVVATMVTLALPARATIILDLPDLTLQPSLAGQTFTIAVRNDGATVALNGVQLELVVEDGGPPAGGSSLGPGIQAASLISPGLLFAANNQGTQGAGSLVAQVFQRSVATTGVSTIDLLGGFTDLATVTFDTTGIAPGLYNWSASTSPNGISFFTDTTFPPAIADVSFADGTLTIVPEPSTVFAGLFLVAVAVAHWLPRWRKKARAARSIV